MIAAAPSSFQTPRMVAEVYRYTGYPRRARLAIIMRVQNIGSADHEVGSRGKSRREFVLLILLIVMIIVSLLFTSQKALCTLTARFHCGPFLPASNSRR